MMTDETQHDDAPEDIDRRRFLNGTWKVLGVALVAEAAWTSYDILHPKPAAGFGGGGRRRARGRLRRRKAPFSTS